MTKPLDPEIKALRAVARALEDPRLDRRARWRTLDWAWSRFRTYPDADMTTPTQKEAAG